VFKRVKTRIGGRLFQDLIGNVRKPEGTEIHLLDGNPIGDIK
jgi:hypothetical protein